MKKNRKNRLNIPVKLISLAAIIFLVLMFVMVYTWKFLTTSDYFKIKEVITGDTSSNNLSYLKGKNIFSIDLRQESRYILEYFPECKNIRLVRILPNRVFVDLIRRKPLALLKLYKYFSVDEDMVVFDAGGDPQQSGLPVITGMETKIFGAKSGRKYNIKELEFALNIIKEVKRNRLLRDYGIRKIYVPDTTNASVFIIPPPSEYGHMDSISRYEGLEVKLSSERIRYKISLLANLMVAGRKELNNIKYIDIRFKEPVIKLKFAQ